MNSPPEPSSQRDESSTSTSANAYFDSQSFLEEHLSSYFERKQSSTFYENERSSAGRGYRRIVANALYPDQCDKYVDLLREEDVDLHVDIAILLDDLPKQHHQRLFDALHRVKANGELSSSTSSMATSVSPGSSPSLPFVARLPQYSEMDHVYIGRFSKISILTNLPYPAVKTVGSHAYIPLREALRDLFAYPHTNLDSPPTPTATPPPGRQYRVVYVEKLSQSKAGRAFIQSCRDKFNFEVVEVYIIKWSDGWCDPFNVKNNRVSHWILSMSFSPPDSKFYTTDNTYVIAAGPSNESHMPVVDKIREEWEEMQATVDGDLLYHATKKTLAHVSLGYLAVIQDAPERTSDNCVPAGNGSLNARFGLSVDYQTVWKKILPCDRCKIQLEGNYQLTSTCQGCTECTCWAIDPSQNLLAFKPLAGFPAEEVPANGLLPVLKFSYPELLEAYFYGHTKLLNKDWKPPVYEAYIAYKGICKQVGESVIKDVRQKWNIKGRDSRGPKNAK
eukprot:scaffold155213_cov54-Attheya_sp.AAC.2